MKKSLFFPVCLLIGSVAFAQDSTHRFEAGLGLGLGAYTDDASVINASINLDADYYFSRIFSLFGHLDYNRSFATAPKESGSLGFATSHIGPRIHFGKGFFAGVGLGAAFYTGDGESSWFLSYYPQIGYNFRAIQLSADYKVLTEFGYSIGMIELGLTFKIHHQR